MSYSSPPAPTSTFVACDGDEVEVRREGAVSTEDILRTAG